MYTQNTDAYGDGNSNDANKKRSRNAVEMQIAILESENKKFLSEKSKLNTEIRRANSEKERLKVILGEKEKELSDLDQKIRLKQGELDKARKKLQTL